MAAQTAINALFGEGSKFSAKAQATVSSVFADYARKLPDVMECLAGAGFYKDRQSGDMSLQGDYLP